MAAMQDQEAEHSLCTLDSFLHIFNKFTAPRHSNALFAGEICSSYFGTQWYVCLVIFVIDMLATWSRVALFLL